MVNVDAKIASKVIANRIKCCFLDIIHHNQCGFIKDKFIEILEINRLNEVCVNRLFPSLLSLSFKASLSAKCLLW